MKKITKQQQATNYWHLAHILALRAAGCRTVTLTMGRMEIIVCPCKLCADYLAWKIAKFSHTTEARNAPGPTIDESGHPNGDADLFLPRAR